MRKSWNIFLDLLPFLLIGTLTGCVLVIGSKNSVSQLDPRSQDTSIQDNDQQTNRTGVGLSGNVAVETNKPGKVPGNNETAKDTLRPIKPDTITVEPDTSRIPLPSDKPP